MTYTRIILGVTKETFLEISDKLLNNHYYDRLIFNEDHVCVQIDMRGLAIEVEKEKEGVG
jgi:hypothetical protein